MEKLFIFLMILASTLMLWVKDTEIYLMDRGYRQLQYSLQHAVHDGALQVDIDALGEGTIVFNQLLAEERIRESLQKNLGLDNQLRPISTPLLDSDVSIEQIVYFDDSFIDPITSAPIQFPYVWTFINSSTNEQMDRVIFGPSVALVINVDVKGDEQTATKLAIQEYKF